ncbi:MAG: hypothetical protein AAFO94_16355 [Bacteroidota bacterium]
MDPQSFLQSGILQKYVLGIADPDESALAEDYINIYPEVKAHWQSMHSSMQSYASSQGVEEPDDEEGGTPWDE